MQRPTKFLLCPIVFLIGLVICAENANSDMLMTADREQPVYGLFNGIENQSGIEHVIFQAHPSDPSNAGKIVIARDKVVALVINIEQERMSRLDPVMPAAYRDYAEELAAQKIDPEARELAIRLYLIAAVAGNDDMRRSCLAGLVPLARNDVEKQKFEMLQLTAGSGGELAIKGGGEPDNEQISPRSLEILINLVRATRQRRNVSVDDLLSLVESDVQRIKLLAELDASVDEIRVMSNANRLSGSELLKLLRIEQMLMAMQAGESGDRYAGTDWATMAMEPAEFHAQMPTPATVTEFDPEENRFRDGNWVNERADER